MNPSRSPVLLVLGGVVVGLVLGYAFARFQSGPSGPEFGRHEPEERGPESAAEDRSIARRNTESVPSPTSRPEAKDAEEEQWKELAWEKEKRRRLDAIVQPTDTGLQAMRRIIELGGDPEQLFKDFDSFKRPLTSLGDPEIVVHLEPATANETLASLRREDISGTLFIFSAGEFELREQIRVKDARHVVIRGQGPDRTIVKLTNSELFFSNGIDNLTIEDMTIDGTVRSEGVIDSRGASSLLLQRLRIFGFDASAGHSAAVGVSSECYLALDECEFLGGHGRGPYSGSAVSLRARGFVYIRNCNMPELQRFVVATERVVEGSIVVAEACKLPWNGSIGTWDPGVDVRLQGCHFENVGRGLSEGQSFRDLGGNVIRLVEPDALPDLESAVTALESDGFRISSAEVEASLNQFKGDAAYVIVTSDGATVDTAGRWFFASGKLSSRTLPEEKSRRNSARPLALTASVSAARALATASSAARAGHPNAPVAAERIELEPRREGGPVWHARFRYAGSYRVDAATGALLE